MGVLRTGHIALPPRIRDAATVPDGMRDPQPNLAGFSKQEGVRRILRRVDHDVAARHRLHRSVERRKTANILSELPFISTAPRRNENPMQRAVPCEHPVESQHGNEIDGVPSSERIDSDLRPECTAAKRHPTRTELVGPHGLPDAVKLPDGKEPVVPAEQRSQHRAAASAFAADEEHRNLVDGSCR